MLRYSEASGPPALMARGLGVPQHDILLILNEAFDMRSYFVP
jgi:hypothetical protein